MEDCIFCKIVAGKIPAHKIYEDDQFLAFLDLFPYVEGHTLVIPKTHYRWVWDVENVGEYMQVCKKIANHFRKVAKTDLVYSFIFGQEVPHAHIHLLPYINKQDFERVFSNLEGARKQKLDDVQGKALVSKLKLD